MLVDLPVGWRDSAPEELRRWHKVLSEMNADVGDYPIRLSKGVYLVHLNFDHEIDHLTWDKDNKRSGDFGTGVQRLWTHEVYEPDMWEPDEPGVIAQTWPYYGVCDHWSQVLVKFPQLQDSVIPYLVELTEIRKEDQYAHGGWRWHKWGPYIGAFQRQAKAFEYLYDTPDVEEVFVYEVHEMHVW